ncbi:MAG: hypothetical protein JJE47_09780 [Acidimicrobiia bacterium]|nr:hypothetical protein [Acidimicrobiia bacterium]
MRFAKTQLAVASLGAMVMVSACSRGAAVVEFIPPATVEEVSGDTLPLITLTESAVTRLAIETHAVESAANGSVVPSAAVLITVDGSYWVYTNPEPLVYLRHEIKPVVEENQQAFFSDGPEPGMLVVVAGVPELYGTETGIGK